MNRRRKENYNFSEIHKNFIKKLGQKTQVGLVVFGSPYSLQNIQNTQFLICGYEDNIFTQRNIVQSLIGKNKIEGKLPVSIGEFKVGEGLEMMPQTTQTLASSFEGATSVDKDSLQKIDILMKKALKDKLFAGSQVLVIHKNQIIFDKNYGKTAYKKTFNPQNITENHLFDIASLTKVLATLPAIMYLYEQKRFNLEDKVSDYLEDLKNTNKEDITIQELLTHQSGLEPFQAHYKRTLSKNTPSPIFYNKQKNEVFSLKVAENLYARADLKDSLWKWTKQCKRNPKEPNGKYKYEYSDINFYILKKLADKLLNQPAEIFIKKYLYEPLGLKKTTFNPLENTEQKWIVPTEKDTYFRMQTIWGYVHDPGAAMHGGIAGHAGLFSTAKEVGILMQMFLQKGKYGEKQFFKPETIETFIKPPFEENRRGLGWDRIDKMPLSYVPDKASENSFGHSGFTGCMAWADIKYDLVIVILSNRVHPEVKKEDPFVKQHFRRKIMNCVYEGIKN
jgi:CubicO group peptidase (beta-lactamase class C family)